MEVASFKLDMSLDEYPISFYQFSSFGAIKWNNVKFGIYSMFLVLVSVH